MPSRVEFEVPDDKLEALDRAIAAGQFPNRATAFEEVLRRLLESADIGESYRRAYSGNPEEDVYGEVGVRLMEEQIREMRSGSP